LELTVAGRGGVSGDADAVYLNVTAVLPAASGLLTVFPCGSTRPVASIVNCFAGDTVPNALLAEIGNNVKVCTYTLAATDIIADVNGYAPPTDAPGNQPPVAGFCMCSFGYVDDLWTEGDTLPVGDPVPGDAFSDFVYLRASTESCGRSNDPDGAVVSLEWFLDGHSSSTEAEADVDWPVAALAAGLSEVRQVVTDDDGATGEAIGYLDRG
jgi:hypothetical protein